MCRYDSLTGLNIVGAQSNGQSPQGWRPPQCKYHGSVKHNDPAALSKYEYFLELVGRCEARAKFKRVKV